MARDELDAEAWALYARHPAHAAAGGGGAGREARGRWVWVEVERGWIEEEDMTEALVARLCGGLLDAVLGRVSPLIQVRRARPGPA